MPNRLRSSAFPLTTIASPRSTFLIDSAPAFSCSTESTWRFNVFAASLKSFSMLHSGSAATPASSRSCLVSGQRRSLVEEYYGGVNWRSPLDVRKMLAAFSHVLADTVPGPARDELIAALRLDGFRVEDNGRIEAPAPAATVTPLDVADPDALQAYERRIHQNVVDDPDLAIGSSKELVEAVCTSRSGRPREIPAASNTSSMYRRVVPTRCSRIFWRVRIEGTPFIRSPTVCATNMSAGIERIKKMVKWNRPSAGVSSAGQPGACRCGTPGTTGHLPAMPPQSM